MSSDRPTAILLPPANATELHGRLVARLARLSTMATERGRRVPHSATTADSPHAERLIDEAAEQLVRAGISLGLVPS